LGYFKIKGNHQQANKIVKITPPSTANPPSLKSKKCDHDGSPSLASPIIYDHILAPKMAVGIPIKQNQ
jgi:hypothetical protein